MEVSSIVRYIFNIHHIEDIENPSDIFVNNNAWGFICIATVYLNRNISR